MSEVRRLTFRSVDGTQSAPHVKRPAWLGARAHSVRPAPFAGDTGASGQQEQPAQSYEESFAQPPPVARSAEVAPPPIRRSSLPPRKSVFPPATVSRMPPPPAPIAEEPRITAEQEAFAQAALELAAARARVLSSVESELLSLAVHIAETIIEREVRLDPSLHSTLARTAVLSLGDTQSARLRVSRAAYRAITETFGEAALDVDGVHVEVSMDNSLDSLSVVAEAGPSRVDGRVSERLAAVLRALEAEHRRNNADLASDEVP